MPLRLYRRVRIAPGVRLNLSRGGPSLSVGPRGAHVTVGGRRGRRTTVGIPGTGVSYTTYAHHRSARVAIGGRRGVTASVPVATGPTPPMLPSAKIALGVVLTVLVITAPVGIPLLIVGLVQRTKPLWRARALIHDAERRGGEDALPLYLEACTVAPQSPEPRLAVGDCLYHLGRFTEAATAYTDALRLGAQGWTLRGHLGHALLLSGQIDDAIRCLQEVRTGAPLTDDSRASISANLAIAFLAKGDAAQALELVRAEPLQLHTLGDGLQQCLFIRGIAQYALGHRARAVQDLDRLYALAADFTDLTATRQQVMAGTYDLTALPAVAAARARPTPAVTSSG